MLQIPAKYRVNRVIAYKEMQLFLPSYDSMLIDYGLNPPPLSLLHTSWPSPSFLPCNVASFLPCIDASHLRRSSFLLSIDRPLFQGRTFDPSSTGQRKKDEFLTIKQIYNDSFTAKTARYTNLPVTLHILGVTCNVCVTKNRYQAVNVTRLRMLRCVYRYIWKLPLFHIFMNNRYRLMFVLPLSGRQLEPIALCVYDVTDVTT